MENGNVGLGSHQGIYSTSNQNPWRKAVNLVSTMIGYRKCCFRLSRREEMERNSGFVKENLPAGQLPWWLTLGLSYPSFWNRKPRVPVIPGLTKFSLNPLSRTDPRSKPKKKKKHSAKFKNRQMTDYGGRKKMHEKHWHIYSIWVADEGMRCRWGDGWGSSGEQNDGERWLQGR